jgi:hypothetical protein
MDAILTEVRRVMKELGELNVPCDSIWLRQDREGELEGNGHLLGLKVNYHDGEDEFVGALRFGRAHPISLPSPSSHPPSTPSL